jgi:hypothetical protein
MTFDPEVFISYAHIDDQSAWGGVPWVSTFYKALDARIEQLRGEPVGIFFDPALQGNELLRPALLDRLKRAGVFVPVLTPRYIKSEWTRGELTGFCAAACDTGGLTIGDKSRIFTIVKTAVPRSEHPPELQDLITYDFFQIEPGTDVARELEIGPLYYRKIDDVARHMKGLLDQLEGVEARQKTAQAKTIYLADTTWELQPQHEALRRDLEQKGHTVLPSRALPIVGTELEKFVREQLSRCDMSVHLVGSAYSFVPEGGKRCVVEIQNELALERGKIGNFAHLIWVAPGLNVEDLRQRTVLAALRENPDLQDGTDLLESSLEDLKTVIHSRLEKGKQPFADKQTGTKRIYLIYDREDREAVLPWSDFLFDQGLEVDRPAFDGDETEIRQLHDENLRTADAVVIYYGAGKDAWIQATLRGLQRRKAEQTHPLRAIAILLAPPVTLEKQHFRTHLALALPQWQGLEAKALDQLLRLLDG